MLLILWIRTEKSSCIFASCMLASINVYCRTPNILHMIMYGVVIWYCVLDKKTIRDFVKIIGTCCISVIGGLALGFVIEVGVLGWEKCRDSYLTMFATFLGKNTGSHSASSMFPKIIKDFLRTGYAWRGLMIALGVVAVTLLIIYKRKIYIKYFPQLLLVFGAALGVIFYIYCRYCVSYVSDELFQIYAYISLAVSIWGMVYYKADIEFSSICLINVLLTIVLPIGTDVGAKYYIYFEYFTLFVLFMILIKCIKDEQLYDPLRNMSYVLIMYFTVILLLTGLWYQHDHVYRDDSYKALTESMNEIPELRGMKTSVERSQFIKLVHDVLDDYSDYEVISLGDFNIIPLITDMKCYLPTSWPDLKSYSPESFEEDIDRKLEQSDSLPVIVLTPTYSLHSLDDLSPYRHIEKYKKLMWMVNTYEYSTLYEDDNLIVYVPE